MDMEMKQVKKSDILMRPRHKEWLYTGIYDRRIELYISFVLIRTPLGDQITFTVFDLKQRKPFVFQKMLSLHKEQAEGELDLCSMKKHCQVRYSGRGEEGWQFTLASDGISASLRFMPEQPFFREVYQMIRNKYSLLQYFQNQVYGSVTVHKQKYQLDDAMGFYDRCFGIVSRKTGWYWLAVQNEDAAFTVWVHDEADSPNYSHVLHKSDEGISEWIQLNPDAVFNKVFKGDADNRGTEWRVTSPDVELNVEILMSSPSHQKLPPIAPIFINLQHDEHFVRVKGRILINNVWVQCEEMYGVMEEHKGIW